METQPCSDPVINGAWAKLEAQWRAEALARRRHAVVRWQRGTVSFGIGWGHGPAVGGNDLPLRTWFVNFHNGLVDDFAPKLNGLGNAWCVRGGMHVGAY